MNLKIVIDVEMCKVQFKVSTYPHKNEIIQIGAVRMNEDYEILDTFSTYVKPRYGKVDRFIGTLTGISERTIKDAPDIEDALLGMLQWIGDDEAVYYSWSQTDYYQIRNEIQCKCHEDDRWAGLLDQANWIDYQKILGNRLEASNPLKLSEALDLAEIDTEGHLHDGADDALNTARMISKLERQKDYKMLIERLRASEKDQEPLTASLGDLFQGLKLK